MLGWLFKKKNTEVKPSEYKVIKFSDLAIGDYFRKDHSKSPAYRKSSFDKYETCPGKSNYISTKFYFVKEDFIVHKVGKNVN